MPEDVREIAISNDTAQLECVRSLVNRGIHEAGFPDRLINQVMVAVDEAVTNVIAHAYDEYGMEPAQICIRQHVTEQEYRIEIIDNGSVFDPHRVGAPDIPSHVSEGRPGGLGIFLMRQIMDVVDYSFEAGKHNRLLLLKRAWK